MKITVIGAAGVLGSCAVFNLIVDRLCDEVVMIDPWVSMLKSHWMDLSTAATVKGITVRSGSYENLAGSDIVVDTAGAPSGAIKVRSELLPANLPIIREHAEKISQYCPEAIVITATNPVDSLNYTMYLLSQHKDRRKFLGYSLNDSIRFRMWSAEALGVKPDRVKGVVIGEHGNSQVMLFSTLTLDGKPVKFDEETKKKIREQPPVMLKAYESLTPKRTAGWTTAIGVSALVRAIVNDSREMIPVNIVLNGEYGASNLSMTVPAIIGKNGMHDILELKLADDEQEGVKNTIQTLEPYMRYVEKTFGKE